jgi:hypothetical protein
LPNGRLAIKIPSKHLFYDPFRNQDTEEITAWRIVVGG